MIKTDGKNLIIVAINSSFPVDDLQGLQKEIINVIRDLDYDSIEGTKGCPFPNLLYLLESTLPTYHQQRHILEFNKWIQDPEPDKGEFEKWLKKSTEWIKNEKE